MARYFAEISYDGTRYHGWQVQPNGITVQEVLEKALSVLLREQVSITGCGRTDTGVHATFFVFHFDTSAPGPVINELVYKLNGFLPDDILIKDIRRVEDTMHARFSATYRTYSYVLWQKKPVFNRTYCHFYPWPLDIRTMNNACEVLKEYTDFSSFSKLHTDVKTNNCRIFDATWTPEEDGYNFQIKADRFLRNMVRAIVGTMLEVGGGKISLEEFRAVIESKDRGNAGLSVPAKGLFLVDVGY